MDWSGNSSSNYSSSILAAVILVVGKGSGRGRA